MADNRERQAFLGFPLLVPLLLGIQLPIWADRALHAAGEGGGAEGLVDRHVLLHLHGLPGGHEGFKDFCERQDRHLRIRCIMGTTCVFVVWVCLPTRVKKQTNKQTIKKFFLKTVFERVKSEIHISNLTGTYDYCQTCPPL